MTDQPLPAELLANTPAISRNTVTKDVLNHLRTSILTGRLRGGERVVELRLAQDLGTSRAPIREALRQLEQEGLIETITHRGTFVCQFSRQDIEDLFWLRIALEKLAAQLAITRATHKEVEQLKSIVDLMEAMNNDQPDLVRATALDTAFHNQLCRMSHNDRLYRAWASMAGQIQVAIQAANTSFRAFSGFAGGHRRVLEAIQGGKAEAAAMAIEDHIMTGLNSLLATLPPEDSVN